MNFPARRVLNNSKQSQLGFWYSAPLSGIWAKTHFEFNAVERFVQKRSRLPILHMALCYVTSPCRYMKPAKFPAYWDISLRIGDKTRWNTVQINWDIFLSPTQKAETQYWRFDVLAVINSWRLGTVAILAMLGRIETWDMEAELREGRRSRSGPVYFDWHGSLSKKLQWAVVLIFLSCFNLQLHKFMVHIVYLLACSFIFEFCNK